ncbi:GIY-YIG nuclease family protein [Dokdonia donghaensis]|uniref:Excinuclease ABC subunit C n=1 Tax=Dokdonia donghaensis DSW-1 TaxID=1300343 RepID=A0A0A2GXS0_9FLAO|nr:GIY-YIG nuclease family protein [Dokdonia donghaensis]KGO08059.1 excinuclease ABC subunit C [Dokdonia donghaensis DSW-1]
MKTYYVYMLKCNDNLIYTGVTNDIARRYEEHQQGRNKSSFTYKRRPDILIWHEVFNDIEQAIAFEKKLKKWSSKKKLALASEDYDMIQALAEGRNASHFKYNPDR